MRRASLFLLTWWPVLLFTLGLLIISCGLIYEPGGKALQ